jgi:hypothetical protein
LKGSDIINFISNKKIESIIDDSILALILESRIETIKNEIEKSTKILENLLDFKIKLASCNKIDYDKKSQYYFWIIIIHYLYIINLFF